MNFYNGPENTKTDGEILADIKRAYAEIKRSVPSVGRPTAPRRPLDLLEGLGDAPIGGMNYIVDASMDDRPRMAVSQKFADLMQPEFVADLNAWMLEFFGRENRVYCLHGHTLTLGPKTLSAMERTMGGQLV